MDLKPNLTEEYSSLMLNNGEKEKVEAGDLNFNINTAHDRSSGDLAAYSIRSESSSLSNQEGNYDRSEDEFDRQQKDQGSDNTLRAKDNSNEDVAVFVEEYEVLWSHSDTAPKNNYQPIQQISTNNANEQFDATRKLEIVVGGDPYKSNLDVVLANLQEAFQRW